MIALYLKIPFHAQIRRADPALAGAIEKCVAQAAAATAAQRHPTDESFFLRFDESSRPCRLQAALAALILERGMGDLVPGLHGWNAIVDISPLSAEEALRSCKRHWYGVKDDGLFVAPEARTGFEGYFRASRPESPGLCSRVLEHLCAHRPLPEGISPPEIEARTLDALVDGIGELGVGDSERRSLVVSGAGDSARRHVDAALRELYGIHAAGFLRLRASAVERWPYSPLIEGLSPIAAPRGSRVDPDGLLSGAERGLLEELAPILEFLRRSPYRAGYADPLDIKLRICASSAFRLYARGRRAESMPAFLVLENADLFPAESMALLREQIEGSFAEEGIAPILAGKRAPDSWPASGCDHLRVEGLSAASIARAAASFAPALSEKRGYGPSFPAAAFAAPDLAAAAAGDGFRFRLAARIAWMGRSLDPSLPTDELAARALATFPREYPELLLALRLGEGILDDEDMDSFLNSLGYTAGVREPAFSALSELGYVDEGARPKISSFAAASRAEHALEDGGASVAAAFCRRLLALQESRRILPSLALYRRISRLPRSEADENSRQSLLLDCIAADEAYGRSEGPSAEPLDAALGELGSFYSSYAAGDRSKASAALARLESAGAESGAGLASGAIALARAATDYADGDTRGAAAKAKQALMSLHSSGARRAEARAHRFLGLCALAQEQPQEGADYLGNAFDLAAESPDPMECILSAQAEASAYFVLGDLDRAEARIGAAAEWAVASFRSDWEAACAFVQGRIALERGDCPAAEEAFGKVRALSRLYGQADAARRAEIWTGRSAAFADEPDRARDVLARFGHDAEAQWFLAELAYWRGEPEEAAELASRARALVSPRPYGSADAFRWDSGFESLEGMAVGFASERSYLADQIIAFGAFASGIAEAGKDASRAAERAARLSSLAREERLSTVHPSVHLYLFYRYLVLETLSPGSMDASTALSKAFKALQLRAARMTAAAEKDGFMEGNRWNRALLAEARRRKLI